MSRPLTFGTLFTALGRRLPPDRPALIHGDVRRTWAELDGRTNALASALRSAGLRPGAKVAHLMRNSPAYLETLLACFKARLVHVNINYRYSGEELAYVLTDADAEAIIFDPEFSAAVRHASVATPLVRLLVATGEDTTLPSDVQGLEALCGGPSEPFRAKHLFDDLLFVYTGGTTGYPKGVMWEQGVLCREIFKDILEGDPEHHLQQVLARAEGSGSTPPSILTLPPFMHGSGLLLSLYVLGLGGTVITQPGRHFDPAGTLATLVRERPDLAVIVGDGFAAPLVRAAGDDGDAFASLRVMFSTGAGWSPANKQALLALNPGLELLDSLGSSESLAVAVDRKTSQTGFRENRFLTDPSTVVLDDDLEPLPRGSDRVGKVGRIGALPLGYYKDPTRTAQTFIDWRGQRLCLTGDHAMVAQDGALILLGRGSGCINSGGEKVFPEEVEEALKRHPAVLDAIVVGLPDARWGQVVAAVVEAQDDVDLDALSTLLRSGLAGYKVPKRYCVVATAPRLPSGKPDYDAARCLLSGSSVAPAASTPAVLQSSHG